jgi:hypothetical protein
LLPVSGSQKYFFNLKLLRYFLGFVRVSVSFLFDLDFKKAYRGYQGCYKLYFIHGLKPTDFEKLLVSMPNEIFLPAFRTPSGLLYLSISIQRSA